jgi:hypothetical protein
MAAPPRRGECAAGRRVHPRHLRASGRGGAHPRGQRLPRTASRGTDGGAKGRLIVPSLRILRVENGGTASPRRMRSRTSRSCAQRLRRERRRRHCRQVPRRRRRRLEPRGGAALRSYGCRACTGKIVPSLRILRVENGGTASPRRMRSRTSRSCARRESATGGYRRERRRRHCRQVPRRRRRRLEPRGEDVAFLRPEAPGDDEVLRSTPRGLGSRMTEEPLRVRCFSPGWSTYACSADAARCSPPSRKRDWRLSSRTQRTDEDDDGHGRRPDEVKPLDEGGPRCDVNVPGS